MPIAVLIVLVVLALFLVVGFLVWVLILVPPVPPALEKDVYLRQVYVVVDQTRSIEKKHRQEIKRLAGEVVGRVGLGDKAYCYQIVADFDELGARVFGHETPPKVPANWLSVLMKRNHGDFVETLSARWREFEETREPWLNRVTALEKSPEEFSDYVHVFNTLGNRIALERSDGLKQVLIVLGDLKHSSPDVSRETSSRENKRQFFDTDVYLVCPDCMSEKEGQGEIEKYWRTFFRRRGNRSIQILSLDAFAGRFPESCVPSLQELQSSAEWTHSLNRSELCLAEN